MDNYQCYFPWNAVSLHRFKRISLFLFLWENSTLCSCSCIVFVHIWGEKQPAQFSAMLWFPSAPWQDSAEYLQKASLSSTKLVLRLFFSPFPFSSAPQDAPGFPARSHGLNRFWPQCTYLYYSGVRASRGDPRVYQRHAATRPITVQRHFLVGLAGSCVKEQMSDVRAQWLLLCCTS